MQYGRRDDHLVEGLVVTPDGEVRGFLLLAAAEGYRGQREAGGRGGGGLALAPWPCSRHCVDLETPCLARPAGLRPWAPRSPPAPGTPMPNGAREDDLGPCPDPPEPLITEPSCGLGHSCSIPGAGSQFTPLRDRSWGSDVGEVSLTPFLSSLLPPPADCQLIPAVMPTDS